MLPVLMPAYNAAAYLGPAIDSVLAQTVRDVQLLIIDDGSKDDTLAIANAGHSGGWARSGWARGFGEQINNRYRAFADPRTDGHLAGFQSGIDLMRGEWLPGHRDVAGVYFAYANANVDVTGLVTNEAATNYVLRKTGSLNLNGWSGGAYWTHYGPRGWYLDAVLQATAYEGTASTIFAAPTKSATKLLTGER